MMAVGVSSLEESLAEGFSSRARYSEAKEFHLFRAAGKMGVGDVVDKTEEGEEERIHDFGGSFFAG
jgi:hypothetical protein